MYGNELLVKYDNGLELGKLWVGRSTRNAQFGLQMR